MAATPTPYDCFVTTTPGLEPITSMELRALGIEHGPIEAGGIPFMADAAELYAANLHLRTASRVVVRAGSFHAASFRELERHARRMPWERFLVPGRPVRLRVTCRKSRLYHSDAVAQRVMDAIGHRMGVPAATVAGGEDDDTDTGDAQLFVVRLDHDRCTVSADASGRLLHMRGYRQAVAKAPLRETLAAAMLLGCGWDPATPLVDPMCGSGTIAIEGALLARRIAPGLERRFAFEEWPEFQSRVWSEIVLAARAAVLPAAPAPILASDRDAGAITAAAANAGRAGVAADVELERLSLSEVVPPASGGEGAIVLNPPYGHRVGESGPLRDLYARMGQVARTRFAGWTLAMLSADTRLEGQAGLPFEEAFRTTNGGIRVRLAVAFIQS